MKAVWDNKPTTIPKLVNDSEFFLGNSPEDLVQRTISNLRKQAELWVSQKDGYFEQLL